MHLFWLPSFKVKWLNSGETQGRMKGLTLSSHRRRRLRSPRMSRVDLVPPSSRWGSLRGPYTSLQVSSQTPAPCSGNDFPQWLPHLPSAAALRAVLEPGCCLVWFHRNWPYLQFGSVLIYFSITMSSVDRGLSFQFRRKLESNKVDNWLAASTTSGSASTISTQHNIRGWL